MCDCINYLRECSFFNNRGGRWVGGGNKFATPLEGGSKHFRTSA